MLNTRAQLDTKLLLEEQLASSEVKLADLEREHLKTMRSNEEMRGRLQVELDTKVLEARALTIAKGQLEEQITSSEVKLKREKEA